MQKTARGISFTWHARDPYGVKHIETKKQARQASLLLEALREVWTRDMLPCVRHGDWELRNRVRFDDVLMRPGCGSAFIHVSALGGTLEKRQVFVWLARNKGAIKTAIANTAWKHKARLPDFFFVESKWDDWEALWQKGEKYPELNLPYPYQSDRSFLPDAAKAMYEVEDKRAKSHKLMGMGDPKASFPAWGYPSDIIQ